MTDIDKTHFTIHKGLKDMLEKKTSADDKIRAAWERYNACVDSDLMPDVPPVYERGYLDGQARLADEVRSVLDQLDRVDAVWGDGATMQECRDRLRKLVTP